MSGGAGSVGGSGGMGQQPMGNASAQPGGGGFGPGINNFGGGMGNASAQPYNSGAPTQATTPTNMGSAMGTMFGTLGQPAGNASAQPQPFGMQPMQSPFQAPQQPSPRGEISAQPAVLNPSEFTRYLGGQQTDSQMGMPPGMQNQTQSQMQTQMGEMAQRAMPGGQLGVLNQMAQPMPQPMGQQPAFLDNPDFQAYQKQEQDLGRQMNEYMQKAPMFQQIQDLQGKMRGMAQPTQVAQPMPPGFPTSGMPPGQQPQGPQMPYGMSPLQSPYQMPNPYPNPSPGPGQVSRPDLLKPMGQPMQGGLGALMSGMQQPQKLTKQQIRQQERMGPKRANPFQQQYM